MTDKKAYEVGQTATILVKNPFKEAEALVTIERQGVHREERVVVRGPMPTVRVPVTQDLWPNAFVSVELVKARTTPPPAVEEVLRISHPVWHFRRTATRDTELRGQRIAAGDKVVVWVENCAADTRKAAAKALSEKLHMHVSGFDVRDIDALPLLASGKIDYRSLEGRA